VWEDNDEREPAWPGPGASAEEEEGEGEEEEGRRHSEVSTTLEYAGARLTTCLWTRGDGFLIRPCVRAQKGERCDSEAGSFNA